MLWCVGAAFLSFIAIAYLATGFVSRLRYSLPILPIFALLGGIGCTVLPSSRNAVAVILSGWRVIGILSVPSFKGAFYHSQHHDVFHLSFPFKEMASDIRRDGDAVVFEFPHHSWALQGVIDYYMRGSGMRYILADTLRAEGDWQPALAYFERFVSDAVRVYFVLDRTIGATPFAPEYERILGNA